MLKIFKKYAQLDIPVLLAIYEESLQSAMKRDGISRFQAEEAFLAYLHEDFFSRSCVFYALWSHDGCCVSALRIEPYGDGFLLTGLETAPESRGKGYAGKLLHGVVEYVAQTGNMPIYAHVHKKNAASLSVHYHSGFERIYDYGKLLDGTISNQYYTLVRNS